MNSLPYADLTNKTSEIQYLNLRKWNIVIKKLNKYW
jgi:hypothetical protein